MKKTDVILFILNILLVKRGKMERFISVGYLNDNLYLKKGKPYQA